MKKESLAIKSERAIIYALHVVVFIGVVAVYFFNKAKAAPKYLFIKKK